MKNVESERQSAGRNSPFSIFHSPFLWSAASVLCCLLGMASKETVASAPVMVFLYDRTFVAGSFSKAWKQRSRFYLGLVATWILLGYLVASTGANRNGTAGFNIGVPWSAYWLTQFKAIAHYLRLSFWPHPLVFAYDPFRVRRVMDVAPYAALVAFLAAGTLAALKRRPALGFLGIWFFTMLAPTSLVPGATQTIVEHRMYLALAAVIVAAVLGIYRLGGKAGLAACIFFAAGLGALTAARNRDYRSELAIWKDTALKSPENPIAQNNFGDALLHAGRAPEAAVQYRRALQLDPYYAEARNNLANALLQMGQVEGAIEQFREALRSQPDLVEAHYNLGNALKRAGRDAEAIEQYETALRLKPDDFRTHNNLATILAQSGRTQEAIRHLQAAAQIEPDNTAVHLNLGNGFFMLKRWDDARAQYEEVLRLDPGNAMARENLRRLQAAQRRATEAR